MEDLEDFAKEARREVLRERRSQRRQRMLRSISWSFAIVLFALGGTRVPLW
jgi:hypothetical protein